MTIDRIEVDELRRSYDSLVAQHPAHPGVRAEWSGREVFLDFIPMGPDGYRLAVPVIRIPLAFRTDGGGLWHVAENAAVTFTGKTYVVRPEEDATFEERGSYFIVTIKHRESATA